MANNPYVNKVQKADGSTIIDISDSTAIASDVAQGKYFYLATGQKVAGALADGDYIGYGGQLDLLVLGSGQLGTGRIL